MTFLFSLLEAAVLAAALSMDAFVASFAYGSNKIRIPLLSAQIINVICSSVVGVSMLAGSLIRGLIPQSLTTAICFVLLFILGLVKLLDSLTKSIIRKHNNLEKQIHFSLLNFRFVLSLYADPEKADRDHSKTISPGEAASLAVALSLDGMAVGFGAALGNLNILAVFLCSLITETLAVLLGSKLGNRLAKKLPFNISWLSGALLLGMAFLKLF